MTKLEVACVIVGLIGSLLYLPTTIKIENGNLADIMSLVALIVIRLCFLAMVPLPLYFRYWR